MKQRIVSKSKHNSDKLTEFDDSNDLYFEFNGMGDVVSTEEENNDPIDNGSDSDDYSEVESSNQGNKDHLDNENDDDFMNFSNFDDIRSENQAL